MNGCLGGLETVVLFIFFSGLILVVGIGLSLSHLLVYIAKLLGIQFLSVGFIGNMIVDQNVRRNYTEDKILERSED